MGTEQIMNLLNNPQVRQLVQALMSQLANGKGSGSANFSSLLDNLNNGGLQQQVSSWLSNGPNQPVSGEQLKHAFGEKAISQAAAEAGTSPQQAADELAQVLPQLVDQASPEGRPPTSQQAQDLVSQLFGR